MNHDAIIDYILQRAWALEPGVLANLAEIVVRVTPTSPDVVAEVVAERDSKRRKLPSGFERRGSVGVIPISGVIAKHANQVNGSSQPRGTSVEQIRGDLEMALADADVRTILLDIDSPGGSVDGVAELAEDIRAARETKPIVALTDGIMASAAYWLGSQADRVLATRGAQVGSIGVYHPIVDSSAAVHARGLKVDVIKAGKNKAAGMPGTSLTPDQRSELQATVDGYFDLFTGAVAEGRRVDREDLDPDAINGSLFLSSEAKRLGLVDEIVSVKGAYTVASSTANAVSASFTFAAPCAMTFNAAAFAAEEHSEPPATPEPEGETMTEPKSEPVDIDAIRAKAREDAVAEERTRVADIHSVAFPGQEDLVAKLVADGVSAIEAAKVLAADQRKAKSQALEAMAQNAPQSATVASSSPTSDTIIVEDVSPSSSAAPKQRDIKAEWNALSAEERRDFGSLEVFEFFASNPELLERVDAESKGG